MSRVFMLACALLLLLSLGCQSEKEVRVSLVGKHLLRVPDSIFSKTDITSLDMNCSGYADYGFSILFDENSNHIGDLTERIGNLTRLRILKVAGNGLKTLPKSIVNLQNLDSLDLSLNKIDIMAELDKLRQLKCLKFLNLSRIPASPEDLQQVGKTLGTGVTIYYR